MSRHFHFLCNFLQSSIFWNVNVRGSCTNICMLNGYYDENYMSPWSSTLMLPWAVSRYVFPQKYQVYTGIKWNIFNTITTGYMSVVSYFLSFEIKPKISLAFQLKTYKCILYHATVLYMYRMRSKHMWLHFLLRKLMPCE